MGSVVARPPLCWPVDLQPRPCILVTWPMQPLPGQYYLERNTPANIDAEEMKAENGTQPWVPARLSPHSFLIRGSPTFWASSYRSTKCNTSPGFSTGG